MSTPAIEVRDVSKRFLLSGRKTGVASFFGRSRGSEFWALQNVSLNVGRGIGFGILGLNGAGKSTLLNIISGSLAPTSGSVTRHGRIAVVQLGAGFDENATGRENVAAQAELLGLPADKVRETVAFAEEFANIDRFFDEPVETYSDGMRSRLGFAAAIAQQPEVFIVDEALAVGDAPFANKCFEFLHAHMAAGGTLLFTSHSTHTVEHICREAAVLHKGRLMFTGPAGAAVEVYERIMAELDEKIEVGAFGAVTAGGEGTSLGAPLAETALFNPEHRIMGGRVAKLVGCSVLVDGRRPGGSIRAGSTIEILARFQASEPIRNPVFGAVVVDQHGVPFFGKNTLWAGQKVAAMAPGERRDFRLTLRCDLAPGDWFMSIALAESAQPVVQLNSLLHLRINDSLIGYHGPGRLHCEIDAIDA